MSTMSLEDLHVVIASIVVRVCNRLNEDTLDFVSEYKDLTDSEELLADYIGGNGDMQLALGIKNVLIDEDTGDMEFRDDGTHGYKVGVMLGWGREITELKVQSVNPLKIKVKEKEIRVVEKDTVFVNKEVEYDNINDVVTELMFQINVDYFVNN